VIRAVLFSKALVQQDSVVTLLVLEQISAGTDSCSHDGEIIIGDIADYCSDL